MNSFYFKDVDTSLKSRPPLGLTLSFSCARALAGNAEFNSSGFVLEDRDVYAESGNLKFGENPQKKIDMSILKE